MTPALRITLVVAVALVTTAGTARADWGYGNVPNPWATQLYYEAFGYGRRNGGDTSATDAAAEVPRKPLKATDFKRTGGRPLVDEFMATTGLDGAAADEFRATLEAEIDSLESQVRKNNVAAAAGVLYQIAYRTVNNIVIDDASRDAVIQRVNDVLASDRSFKKLQAKERQAIADLALIQAALISLMMAQDDPAGHEVGLAGARKALLELTGSETGPQATIDYGDVID